ncbi:exo-beta-1,4-galactosidase [Chitinophaga japonensis]|uniref:beta-galactosidase n=1 Tax=Chitinophaga japonensis TaxID=104662 RepID=A0A562SLD5_CHIJA|nr:sugar-binding domain-containing protein [Chitinophaga japonensis]TWI81963.1 glycosyl hydrolase family 2 [Chitinophaga japonensis]
MKLKLLLAALLFFHNSYGYTGEDTITLSGNWQFREDPADQGLQEKWYAQRLGGRIRLPGSMRENGKGGEVTLHTLWTGSIYDSSWYFNPEMAKYRRPGRLWFPFWLTPVKYYTGPAWYQRRISIPAAWKGRRVVLTLERPHWETTVWVDGKAAGMQNSLSAPHVYDLGTALTPGAHTITIRVDNRVKEINVGPDSHSITDHTQGNWNGITGRMDLVAGANIWLEDVQVYPDVDNKRIRLRLQVVQKGNTPLAARVLLAASSFNSAVPHTPPPLQKQVTISGDTALLELVYPMGNDLQLWDEFHPALYRLTVTLIPEHGAQDKKRVSFGMRAFKTDGRRFTINGRPLFLRGTVENCVFPLTGYPPTSEADWLRIFRIARAFGLNHMRFHSWCPPEAAFKAADLVGFYLQPEGPSWANHGSSLGDGAPIDQYIYDETNRMAKAYGNYASFCMMAYGNEPRGGKQAQYLGRFVNYWKAKDPRHVYTGASVGMSWPWVPESEFIVKSGPRGLRWSKPPGTAFDYYDRIKEQKAPYVTHEMGQWCVFPDFSEIPAYTGAFRAHNLELFRDHLQRHHLASQARHFLMASGKLQVLCYKAEIEAAFRTPGLAGFQLLSLNDYPGQGTALVGVLNAFWKEKGYVTAPEFRRFCDTTVLLAKMDKLVYTSGETLEARVTVAHFGQGPLAQVQPQWQVKDAAGRIVAQGRLPVQEVPLGDNISLGDIRLPLQRFDTAAMLTLEIGIPHTAVANSWQFWVYPSALSMPDAAGIYVCDTLDAAAVKRLEEGGKVLLLAAGKVQRGREVVQSFTPVFWNTSWFKMRPPHTLGLYCDPAHPAFRYFPTEYHSNYQWWELVNGGQVMDLESFPPGFRPLVYSIDTWFLNRRLAMLAEARIGRGRLLLCSMDISHELQQRPAARQLRYSLLRYMQSEDFHPPDELPLAAVQDIFTPPARPAFNPYTKGSPDELKPKKQAN